MTRATKIIIGVTIVAAVGYGIYKARSDSESRARLQQLQRQQAALTVENERLRGENEDLMRQLALLREEKELPNTNTAELIKLRGELAPLRRDSEELARLKRRQDQMLREPSAGPWIDRLNRVQRFLAQNSKDSIPEIPFADVTAWLNSIQFQIETDDDLRRAASLLRNQAQMKFSGYLAEAVRQYEQANNAQFPTDLSQLLPYLDPGVGSTMLQLYQIVPASAVKDQKPNLQGDWIITRKAPANPGTRQRVAVLSGGVRAWFDTPQ